MSIHGSIGEKTDKGFMLSYLDSLALVERLHRLLLDVIKDEFERVGVLEINAVQALLLFNIGDNEVTAGELKSRGYYQGSNVSYNLKKLVEMGYMHHQRCEVDRRSVRVRLTPKGRETHLVVEALFGRHAEGLQSKGILGATVLTVSPLPCVGSNATGVTRSAISIDLRQATRKRCAEFW